MEVNVAKSFGYAAIVGIKPTILTPWITPQNQPQKAYGNKKPAEDRHSQPHPYRFKILTKTKHLKDGESLL
jgi:hypothetical protein